MVNTASSFRVVLVLLALGVFIGASEAKARAITGYSPSPVVAGNRVTINGSDLREREDRTIRYGSPGASRAEGSALLIHSWSSTAIVVTIPADIEPGTYWLATCRENGNVLTRGPATLVVTRSGADDASPTAPFLRRERPLPEGIRNPGRAEALSGSARRAVAAQRGAAIGSAEVTDGPSCRGNATMRLTGGPFQTGTDNSGGRHGPNRWLSGQTFVEIKVLDPAHNDLWNKMIYEVRVLSESELEVVLFGCIVVQRTFEIRIIYPDGSKSPWKSVTFQ